MSSSWLVSTCSSWWWLCTLLRCFLKPLYVQKEEGHPCSPHFRRRFLAGYKPCWNFKCWHRSEQFLWCVLQTKQVNIITEQFFFNNSLTFVQWWEFKAHVAVVLSAPWLVAFPLRFQHLCCRLWFEWRCRNRRGLHHKRGWKHNELWIAHQRHPPTSGRCMGSVCCPQRWRISRLSSFAVQCRGGKAVWHQLSPGM